MCTSMKVSLKIGLSNHEKLVMVIKSHLYFTSVFTWKMCVLFLAIFHDITLWYVRLLWYIALPIYLHLNMIFQIKSLKLQHPVYHIQVSRARGTAQRLLGVFYSCNVVLLSHPTDTMADFHLVLLLLWNLMCPVNLLISLHRCS